MISKVSWDTTCYDQSLAVSLQNELSDWTKARMGSEVKRILDEWCPDDQVWKIDSLKLDLGIIDYADLKNGLSQTFSKALSDQLRGLLFTTVRRETKIEVSKTADSYFLMFQNYLTKGYMPWWYKPENGNVKEIVCQLLKNHPLALIQLIRKIGQKAEVRKRLIWQFDDAVLQKIVEQLEPYNHAVLTAFRGDLNDIQVKEHLVQSSETYFRKETWLWLLTHLLVERGTLFSKAEFVKSMLNQLTSRYDLNYRDVVSRIKMAFAKKENLHLMPSDLANVISELSIKRTGASNLAESEHWQLLDRYFEDYTVSDPRAKDLLITLSVKSPAKFQSWLLALKKRPAKWASLLKVLDQVTYSSIVLSFSSTYSDSIATHTQLIGDVLSANHWLADRKSLWDIGLDYAIKNLNKNASKPFVEYLIKAFCRQEKITTDQVLSAFQDSAIWARPKTNRHLKLLEELTALQQKPDEAFDSEVFENRIRCLLDEIRQANYKFESAIPPYDQLNRWIVSRPGQVSRILKDYFANDGLPDLLLHNLRSSAVKRLVRHIGEDFEKIIKEFEEQWFEINRGKKVLHSLTKHHESIVSHAMRLLFDHPTTTPKELVRKLIEELSRTMTHEELDQFEGSFREIVSIWNRTSLAFSKAELKRIAQGLVARKEEDFLIRTHELISKRSSNQVLVGSFLLANYHNKEFARARDAETEDLNLILKYFVHDGVRVKRAMIRKALGKLPGQATPSEVGSMEHRLTDLFWKCVLSYRDYWGHEEALKKSFDHSVAFNFNRNPQLISASQAARSRGITLNSREFITHNQLKSITLKGLDQATPVVKYSQNEYVLSECITQLITSDAHEFERLLVQTAITESRIRALMNGIDFGDFTLHFQAKPKNRSSYEALRSLYWLVKQQAPNELLEHFLMHLWRLAWGVLKEGVLDNKAFTRLVSSAVLEIHAPDERDPAVILKGLQDSSIPVNALFKSALIKASEVFELLPDAEEKEDKIEGLVKCETHGLIEPLLKTIFSNKNVPAWFGSLNAYGPNQIINELIKRHPMAFHKQLKDTIKTEHDIEWLAGQLDASTLTQSIATTNPNLSARLDSILKMHEAFEALSISGLPKNQARNIIVKKILVAWTHGHWALLSSDNIWNELIWEVCIKRGVDSNEFKSVIDQNLERFPSGLQLSFRQIVQEEEHLKKSEKVHEPSEEPVKPQDMPLIKDEIMVKNAGMVLLSSYVKMLFERLDLLDGDNFKNQESQQKAAHYLQYVVTGLSETEESLLVLNKVICGLHPTTPITHGIDLTDHDKELVDGLIKAVIGYWPAIGETSIDGFRGNWLVRDGILTEEEERWELSVDKRPYDLLIERSPFSFSIIKYPWMDKPVHVTWPY